MANPRTRRLKRAGGGAPPRAQAGAYTAGSWDHPDMRRWTPDSGSADADLLPEQRVIRARARDLARNHGVAEGAVQTLSDNIVGSGLRLKSRPNWKLLGWTQDQAETWSNLVEARWCAWAESNWVDAGRTLTFSSLTKLAYTGSFVNGEAVGLVLWLDRPGAPASTCVQLVEADRLTNPNGQPDRRDLRGGIEIDEYGAPQAYWIRKVHPGDRFFMSGQIFPSDSVRVPAYTDWGRARVIHLHDKERVGQSRGKPQLASVMRQFKVLGDYTNAELKSAVVNAMVAVVTKSAVGQEQLVELLSSNPEALKVYQDGLNTRGRSTVEFSPGMILPLALGEEFASFTPGRPSASFEPFVLALFRHVAAGLNIPYELLLKDFSKTNYSSARAALLEAWRFFRGRRKWLISYWCQPLFELWLEEEVMQGRIEAPDFYEQRAFYCRAKWIGDGRGWVDPLKEAQASETRMRIGISTLENECAEQGEDWEEILEQRAREEQRAEELGITLPWMVGADTVTERVDIQETGSNSSDPQVDPATGQETDGPAPAAKPAKAAAKSRAAAAAAQSIQVSPSFDVHLPESMSHSFEHHTEGVKELAEQASRGVTRLEQIATNVSRSMEQVAEIAADTARQSSQVQEAVHALSKTVERAANKTIVRDKDGRPTGTRIAD